MLKILINDDIAYWGISAKTISDQLLTLKEGEEVEIEINSPGGSVYEGIAIFNNIRKVAETHRVRIWINGLAASMASYIAIAARAFDKNLKITVNENSIFFIHNPWNYTWGDYRALGKEADYLERLAKVCAQAYSAVSTKELKEIRTAMDEETYYIGQEIVDAGFANDFEALYTEDEEGISERDILVTQAQIKLETVRLNCRKNLKADELEKAVALLGDKNLIGAGRGAGNQPLGAEGTGTPSPQTNTNQGEFPPADQGGTMNPEELFEKHPDCYKKVLALGEKAALEKEQKRVSAHIKVGKECGDLELAVKFIQEGKSIQDDEVHADYMAAAMKNRHLKDRNLDNPGSVKTEGSDEADEKEIMSSFNLGFSGKNLKGEE